MVKTVKLKNKDLKQALEISRHIAQSYNGLRLVKRVDVETLLKSLFLAI